MRGREAGLVGKTPVVYGYSGSAPGFWKLEEIAKYVRESQWPGNSLSVTWYTNYADATLTGSGTFTPTISTSYGSVSHEWQKSTNEGASWSTISGATSSTLTVTSQTIANDGDLYRIIVRGGLREATSASATLRFDTISISWNYESGNATVAPGFHPSIFFAYASAIGDTYSNYYDVSYQWQESTDSGSTWSDMAGLTTTELSLVVTSGMNGRKYRLKATASSVVSYSSQFTLTVT